MTDRAGGRRNGEILHPQLEPGTPSRFLRPCKRHKQDNYAEPNKLDISISHFNAAIYEPAYKQTLKIAQITHKVKNANTPRIRLHRRAQELAFLPFPAARFMALYTFDRKGCSTGGVQAMTTRSRKYAYSFCHLL